ncbi:geranylgeranyl diphosphate synthase type I [Neomicrococcus aestuarii]|uniref:Geranylgeranyl diphosphate synthase type I n=1 Tax=Neomicrococcus aestuarii TaxID=556325 RepID=A0A7W8TVT5_9MICC|nr:polyprenyl synthetase family protein [Neomicrococcus aestuarii]MBB5513743.1 geranylgeranyl diphosphate synthase type I [Neomicrococcus aestuarii]
MSDSSPSATYIAALNEQLADFLSEQRTIVTAISPHATELMDSISELATGGKRLRASLAYWGFKGAGGQDDDAAIVALGGSIELFQTAALIHDDIIDASDTRRGNPSIHRRFEAIHRREKWHKNAERFGESAAILAGDLCLSLSEQLFGTIGNVPRQTRIIFDEMRLQVMAGQYLDVLEENAGPVWDPAGALDRARSILRYKSAKYSAENPVLLGASLAGANQHLLEGYSRFALPLGEAFQLRDDVLGVFGDPATTGKPSGDDLREGKRTELIAHGLQLSSESERTFIQSRLGAADLSDAEVAQMSQLLVDCGALAATERSIEQLSTQSFEALAELDIPEESRQALRIIGEAAVNRSN